MVTRWRENKRWAYHRPPCCRDPEPGRHPKWHPRPGHRSYLDRRKEGGGEEVRLEGKENKIKNSNSMHFETKI